MIGNGLKVSFTYTCGAHGDKASIVNWNRWFFITKNVYYNLSAKKHLMKRQHVYLKRRIKQTQKFRKREHNKTRYVTKQDNDREPKQNK